MKRIVREVQISEEAYVSVDGKEFKTREACEKWEKSYEYTIKTALKNIPQIQTICGDAFIVSPYDSDVLILKPRNMDDIKVINAYGMIITEDSLSDPLTQDDIDKLIMIETGFEEDCFFVYRMEEYLQAINDSYKKFKEKMEDIGEEWCEEIK